MVCFTGGSAKSDYDTLLIIRGKQLSVVKTLTEKYIANERECKIRPL